MRPSSPAKGTVRRFSEPRRTPRRRTTPGWNGAAPARRPGDRSRTAAKDARMPAGSTGLPTVTGSPGRSSAPVHQHGRLRPFHAGAVPAAPLGGHVQVGAFPRRRSPPGRSSVRWRRPLCRRGGMVGERGAGAGSPGPVGPALNEPVVGTVLAEHRTPCRAGQRIGGRLVSLPPARCPPGRGVGTAALSPPVRPSRHGHRACTRTAGHRPGRRTRRAGPTPGASAARSSPRPPVRRRRWHAHPGRSRDSGGSRP